MKVITKQSKIDTVAERWREQYWYGPEKRWLDVSVKSKKTSKQIYNELLSCKTEREIVDIIGNTSWTENECDECEKDNDKVIEYSVGDEYTFCVCKSCLKKSLSML